MTEYNAYGLKTIKKYAEMGKQFAQEGQLQKTTKRQPGRNPRQNLKEETSVHPGNE